MIVVAGSSVSDRIRVRAEPPLAAPGVSLHGASFVFRLPAAGATLPEVAAFAYTPGSP